MCRDVCVRACMDVCACVCARVYACMFMYRCVCVCMCRDVCVCACMGVCVRVHARACVCACVFSELRLHHRECVRGLAPNTTEHADTLVRTIFPGVRVCHLLLYVAGVCHALATRADAPLVRLSPVSGPRCQRVLTTPAASARPGSPEPYEPPLATEADPNCYTVSRMLQGPQFSWSAHFPGELLGSRRSTLDVFPQPRWDASPRPLAYLVKVRSGRGDSLTGLNS